MNIKKFLLNCLAFGSFSCTQAFGFQVYSDVPTMDTTVGQFNRGDGLFLNCAVEAAENIKLLDDKVNEITKQEKFNEHSVFKEKLAEIVKITDPQNKLAAYMGLIGLSWGYIPSFLKANREGLKSYAENLQGNTGLPTELGIEVLDGLQSAINEFMLGGSQQQVQKA